MESRNGEASFERQLSTQIEMVRRNGRRMLRGADHDVDDFTQEVLLRAWAHRDRLRETDSLSRWVAAIARNAARNTRRTRSQPPSGDVDGLLDERPTVSDELETTERWERLLNALGALDATNRELLIARYVDDATYDELQALHGLSYAAVTSRVRRAKQHARRLIQATLGSILAAFSAKSERAFAQTPRSAMSGSAAMSTILATSGLIVGAVAVGVHAYGPTDAGPASREIAVTGVSEQTMGGEETMGDLQVRREDGRVWIEAVPGGQFGEGWDRFLLAMQALLKARGVDADMATLMALSGDAFALCHASHWQGVANLAVPTDPVRNLAEAYGFEYGATHEGYTGPVLGRPMEERERLTGDALARLRQEIDAGRPVLIAGAEDHCGSCSVVVGYSEEDGTLCHVGDGEPYRWTPIRGVTPGAVDYGFGVIDGRIRGIGAPGANGGWYANPIYLLGVRETPPSARERALSALRVAVALHDSPTYERSNWGGVEYFFGARAYAEWEKALRELRYPEDLSRDVTAEVTGFDDAYDWYAMDNMVTQVDQIVRGRSAAAALLDRSVDLFPEASEFVRQAARHYREEVDIAKRKLHVFIPRDEDTSKERAAWLSDETNREDGAGAIAEMAVAERAAIAQIEKVLGVVDPGEMQ